MSHNSPLSPDIKKDLLGMASNLDSVSSGWVVNYDPETDSLSFSKSKLSSDTKISYLDPEIAVYLSGKKEIEGVFIEYATKNYMSHNKELANFKKKLVALSKNEKSDFIQIKKSDAKSLIHALQEEMKEIVVDNLNCPSHFTPSIR